MKGDKKRKRNRESAQRFRKKQKQLINNLTTENAALKDELNQLKKEFNDYIREMEEFKALYNQGLFLFPQIKI